MSVVVRVAREEFNHTIFHMTLDSLPVEFSLDRYSYILKQLADLHAGKTLS